MLKLTNSLKFLTIILTIWGCDKSTSNNENYIKFTPPKGNYYSTAFCKINDSDWYDCSPNGGIIGWKGSGVIADYHYNSWGTPLEIQANNSCDSNFSSLYIYLIPFNGNGKYQLTKKNNGSYGGFICDIVKAFKPYETNYDYIGFVEITDFNYKEKYISGTFSFDALYTDSNQVVKIRDGKFIKVKYN